MLRTILFVFVYYLISYSCYAQDFRWGLKGGIGYSFYKIVQTDFTDPKGDPFTFEGVDGVTSILLGASGYLKFNNSSFYFAPEFYYIRGGGKIEFSNLSARTPGGEKTMISQKDQLIELAALLGYEVKKFKFFTGPNFSYRISTNGTASDYLDNIFLNSLGETNSQSLYLGLSFGIGYSLNSNSSISLRYGLPILGYNFSVENNTYINNASFSMFGLEYIHLFESNK